MLKLKNNPRFKRFSLTLLWGVMVLLVLVSLVNAYFDSNKNTDEVLDDFGIQGMRISQFKINNNEITKTRELGNGYEFETEYKKVNGKVRQDVYLTNKEKTSEDYSFSQLIEIDYSEIMWHGKKWKLTTSPVRLNSWTSNGNLIVPNIFMGKENKRINYRDVAEQGGYALAYKSNGKYYIELRIDSVTIKSGERKYIDPTFTNSTKGFSTVAAGASNLRGIGANSTDIWVLDGSDNALYHFNSSGYNMTHHFDLSAVGIGSAQSLSANDTDIWVWDDDGTATNIKIADGSNITSNSLNVNILTGTTGNAIDGIVSNGTDLWVADWSKYVTYHIYNKINQSDAFSWATNTNDFTSFTIRRGSFWTTSTGDDFIQHYNKLGVTQGDGFSSAPFGIGSGIGIATDGIDLLIVDSVDAFVYRLETDLLLTTTLNNPKDNFEATVHNITFNCSAEGEKIHNISLFHNISGTFEFNQTLDVSGTEPALVNTTFSVDNIIYGTYIWNCRADNYAANSFWAADNRSFKLSAFAETSQTYNSSTYETKAETFEIVFDDDIGFNLGSIATLNYNGTDYIGIDVSNTTDTIFTKQIDIPLLDAPAQDRTFYWSLALSNSSGTYLFNSTSHTQTIQNITLSATGCVDGTNLSLNFSAYNEENLVALSDFSFYGTFNYWLGNGNVHKNFSISNVTVPTRVLICITPNNETFYSNAQIQYEKVGFVKRTHYLINASLTNTTQDIGLYLLNTTKSTSFIINVIDAAQFAIKDAYIYIQRFYPGSGIFRTVEMAKTDTSGNTIGHFEAETEDYKITIFKDGVILHESEMAKIFCGETPCTLNFQTETSAPTTWTNIGNLSNLVWSLTYNEALKIWSYAYVDTSGTTSYARLKVYMDGGNTQTIICNNSETSSAATITCNVTGYDGTIYAVAYISRSPEILVWLDSIIESATKVIFGNEGLFWATLILLTIGLVGIWNPGVGVVMLIAGMVMINFLKLATFGMTTVLGIIVIGGIILWEIKK